jgi:hypothetical protein
VSALLIVYCVLLIAVAIISLTTGEKVLSSVMAETEAFENAVMMEEELEDANNEAREYFVAADKPDGKVAPSSDVVKMAMAEKKDAPVAPEATPSEATLPTVDTFKVAGGSSVPAELEGPIPEGFVDAESFTSCAAAY